MTPVQPVKGTQSLLGEDADRLATVVAAFDRVRRLYGFKRVEVPTLEHTEVFSRSIGETTDVVSKEMYSFETRGEKSVTLRPEFTAGICRAYLSEGWQRYAPLKVATHGSAFRYEQPQKGRYREFHQLDAEIIGSAEPQADVELLSFGYQLLRELGITHGVTLELNTLGDPQTRNAWREALYDHCHLHASVLSKESIERLERNPLRILDSKAHQDWPVIDSAPPIDAFLSAEAAEFFAKVTEGLDAAGVPWRRNPRLVRGLDYYRHTAFEFITDRLGAQGAVLAGGRYDGLIESIGGPHTPAVGWAAGIERLAELIKAPVPDVIDVAVVVEDEQLMAASISVITLLRQKGVVAELYATGSPRKRWDKAVKRGATTIVSLKRTGPAVGASVSGDPDGKVAKALMDLMPQLANA